MDTLLKACIPLGENTQVEFVIVDFGTNPIPLILTVPILWSQVSDFILF